VAHLYLAGTDASLEAGGRAELLGEEARHAATVARLAVGESIALTNGRGRMAQCVVVEATAKKVRVHISRVDDVARLEPEVWLVQALAKGDRDERAVEACTELGVDTIIPWQAARSISRWSPEKEQKGVARWRKIASEASKQSLRAWVPHVTPLAGLAELCDLARTHHMVLLEPTATTVLAEGLKGSGGPVVLVVGPEGGISPAEREALEEAGAVSVSLGPLVMRTSSAGMAALAIANQVLGRWE
jgi:16S rRNA (uracil1498-N3)-methyltransferase